MGVTVSIKGALLKPREATGNCLQKASPGLRILYKGKKNPLPVFGQKLEVAFLALVAILRPRKASGTHLRLLCPFENPLDSTAT